MKPGERGGYNPASSIVVLFPGFSKTSFTGAPNPLLAAVRSAAAWLEENRYNARVPKEYDNWWDWEIGTPLQLGDLLVLLHDQLTPEETAKYAAAIDRFDSDPRVMR